MTIGGHIPRSWLFVPGNRPDRFPKAVMSGAHAVIFDLEDSVPEAELPRAREATGAIVELREPGPLRFVRVRYPAPYSRLHPDLEASVRPGLDGVVLPKVERSGSVRRVAAALDVWEAVRGLPAGQVRIAVLIESPLGLLNAASIAAVPRVDALLFGSEDYALAMGVEADPDNPAVAHARSALGMTARAGNAIAIDMITRGFSDAEGLRMALRQTRALGLHGKLAIHPGQVSTINAAFLPSEEDMLRARRIVAGFEASDSDGGAVEIDGEMVDLPVVMRARRVIEAWETDSAPHEP